MMKRPSWRCAGLVLAAALPVASAHAQIDSLLKKGGHGGERMDPKGMAGMAGAPLTSGSMGNVAGLLQYCISNNYLSGEDATSVKDRLMGKLPDGGQTRDRGLSDGLQGVLHGSNGNLVDLRGGGLTADVTRKVCGTLLAQGKSFL